MSSTNVTTIQNGYAAFGRGDIPAALSAFAPDIVWDSPATVQTGGRYHGHDGVVQFFTGLSKYYAELHVEPTTWLDAGDHVVAMGRVQGSSSTGNAIDVPFAHVWTMRDGLAGRFTEYLDSAALAAALS